MTFYEFIWFRPKAFFAGRSGRRGGRLRPFYCTTASYGFPLMIANGVGSDLEIAGQ
jgi:hypothetical protein